MLTGDPRVDMISFTGSTAVGKHIAARGAETLKRVFLELGGKSANIVLDDADFAATLAGAGMVCMHSGQGCAITTRLLLPRSRYDEGVEHRARQAFESFPYGDPTDLNNMAGPLINARQRERVLGYIEKGKAEGAKCIVGGGPATQFDKGYFVAADAVRRRRPRLDDRAARRSSARCSSVIPYEDDDDAVRIANNSRYGLSGAVDEQVARPRARASPGASAPARVAVNGGQWFGPDSPFGGYKESGLGREHGVAGFEEYLETKTIGLPG